MQINTFGELIAKARKHSNLTQREIAQILDLHVGRISKVENGHRIPPKLDVVARWLDALDVNAADRYLIFQTASTELAINAIAQLADLPARAFIIKLLVETSLCLPDELDRIQSPFIARLRLLLAGRQVEEGNACGATDQLSVSP